MLTIPQMDEFSVLKYRKGLLRLCLPTVKPLINEYIERIDQMSYSSLSDNGMLQVFSF